MIVSDNVMPQFGASLYDQLYRHVMIVKYECQLRSVMFTVQASVATIINYDCNDLFIVLATEHQ
jgi:hypothetical protein